MDWLEIVDPGANGEVGFSALPRKMAFWTSKCLK
jgi:hypothetical protein